MKQLDNKLNELENDIKYLEKITGIIKTRERIISTYLGIKLRAPNIDEIVKDKSITEEDLELLQKKLYLISNNLKCCTHELDRAIDSISDNLLISEQIQERYKYNEEEKIKYLKRGYKHE